MKITLYGFGETRGKELAKKIKGMMKTMAFDVIQSARIFVSHVPDPKPLIAIEEIKNSEQPQAKILEVRIKKIIRNITVTEKHSLFLSLPEKKLSKSDQIFYHVSKNHPLLRIADCLEEV